VELEQPERPKLSPVSDQMKAWSSALAAELLDWPQLTQKSFFGFTALYRGKAMFGALPRTRGFQGNLVAFRFDRPSRTILGRIEEDPRVTAFDKEKKRWFLIELSSDADLHEAIDIWQSHLTPQGPRRELNSSSGVVIAITAEYT
jgi:hypothetical protein